MKTSQLRNGKWIKDSSWVLDLTTHWILSWKFPSLQAPSNFLMFRRAACPEVAKKDLAVNFATAWCPNLNLVWKPSHFFFLQHLHDFLHKMWLKSGKNHDKTFCHACPEVVPLSICTWFLTFSSWKYQVWWTWFFFLVWTWFLQATKAVNQVYQTRNFKQENIKN